MHEILTHGDPKVKLNGTKFSKEIIKFGKFRHPNPLFRDKDGEWDFTTEEAKKLVKNFDDGVVEQVKFVDIHDEERAEPLGVITELSITDTGVTAVIDVEDEASVKKIQTIAGDGKSIAHGVSSGLDFNFPIFDATDKNEVADGPVLRHVAVANIPWIQGMKEWSKVEESFSDPEIMTFGHKSYTGQPFIHESEDDKEDGNMKTNVQTKKALEILASNSGKSLEDVAKSLGIELEEEDDHVDPVLKNILSGLQKISERLDNKTDDDDKNKGDDDDKTKTKAKGDDALKGEVDEVRELVGAVNSSVKELVTTMSEARTEIDATKKTQMENAAEEAVKILLKEGKVLPKDADTYKTLFQSDKDLFETVTGSLPVQVEFESSEIPPDPFQSNPYGKKLSLKESDEETKRYLSMAQPTEAGKQDSPKSDGRIDA